MNSGAIWDLSWALLSILVVYVLASSTRPTIAIGVLIVLIPFQVVETRFATSSVLMAYALLMILLINGDVKFRMTSELMLMVLAYLSSIALALGNLSFWHAVTAFQFFSCFVVFLLAYNFARQSSAARSSIDLLIVMNCLVVAYCALQVWVGPGAQFVPFGIDSLAFNSNRDASDPRLVGPFSTPGATAGYMTLMIIVLFVEMIFTTGIRRLLVQLLIAGNLLGLVATANRAGVLVLLASFPVLLAMFRHELGPRRVLQYALGGVGVLSLVAMIAVTYTGFGNLFDRLETVTESEQGVPLTRSQTWPIALEKIERNPWFGQGPHFLTAEEGENMGLLPTMLDEEGRSTTTYDPYPHSLYLYLLRTVGIVGLCAVLWFFFRLLRALADVRRRLSNDAYVSSLVRGGLILIPAFLVSQITLEFNRNATIDYAQFVFAVMGLLLGLGDRSRHTQISNDAIGHGRDPSAVRA